METNSGRYDMSGFDDLFRQLDEEVRAEEGGYVVRLGPGAHFSGWFLRKEAVPGTSVVRPVYACQDGNGVACFIYGDGSDLDDAFTTADPQPGDQIVIRCPQTGSRQDGDSPASKVRSQTPPPGEEAPPLSRDPFSRGN
jgi:hypothetical protein